jgi:hypothetical protein
LREQHAGCVKARVNWFPAETRDVEPCRQRA